MIDQNCGSSTKSFSLPVGIVQCIKPRALCTAAGMPYKALASKSSLEESVEVQDRGWKRVWDFEEI